MPFSVIPFLLLFIPILEISAFVVIGGQIGLLMTLAMILVTAVIGSILLRIQGLSTLSRIQAETQAGRIPGKELVHGVMIMIAGVLLLTPGFITDCIGFLLFIPVVRTTIWAWLGSRISVTTFHNMSDQNPFESRTRPAQEGVVDLDEGEYSETTNPDTPWNRKIGKDNK